MAKLHEITRQLLAGTDRRRDETDASLVDTFASQASLALEDDPARREQER